MTFHRMKWKKEVKQLATKLMLCHQTKEEQAKAQAPVSHQVVILVV